MTPLLVTGMFRSGTTMVARALNTHPAIAFASDPFLDFFKVARSELAHGLESEIPFQNPLDDYYFSQSGISLLEKIEQFSLKRPFGFVPWGELVPVIEKRCRAYSSALEPRIQNIGGDTYQAILESLFRQIGECYGPPDGREPAVVGIKEVWATEFTPAFLNAFDNARVILVQRDPRAVAASKNVTDEKYPWLFLARQWRKLSALAWTYARADNLKERIFILKYEDMIHEPERVTRDLCEFLQVDWHPGFADPSTYRDGGGAPWVQNSSYGTAVKGFDTGAADKWKQVLSEKETDFLDYICAPEMSLFGYHTARGDPASGDRALASPPRIRCDAQAKWMRDLIPNDAEALALELEKEKRRVEFLSQAQACRSDDIREAFLHEAVFRAAREQARAA